MDVLQRDKGAAVMQLALQQADVSAVFRAAVSQLSSKQPTRALLWRNKSQEKDACIGTLSHKEAVSSEASAPHASSAAQATPSSCTTPRARSCSRSSRAQVRFRASPSGTVARMVASTLTSPSRSSWLAFRTGRSKSGIRVCRSPQNRPSLAKTDACTGLSGRCAGTVEREAERAQPKHQLGGVFPGWHQDRVRIGRQDDQSLDFGCAEPSKSPLLGQH